MIEGELPFKRMRAIARIVQAIDKGTMEEQFHLAAQCPGFELLFGGAVAKIVRIFDIGGHFAEAQLLVKLRISSKVTIVDQRVPIKEPTVEQNTQGMTIRLDGWHGNLAGDQLRGTKFR